MKWSFWGVIATVGIFAFPQVSLAAGGGREMIAFIHIGVIDGTGKPLMEKMTALISGDRISGLSPDIEANIPKGARVVDCSGKYLIPGLWDMHIHLNGNEYALPLLLANGVTGVREMGCTEEQLQKIRKWQKEAGEGKRVVPCFRVSGPPLDGPRPIPPEMRFTVTNTGQAAAAVLKLKKMKVDFIKVHDWISVEAYDALVREAKRNNMIFVGHVPATVRAAQVSDSGQKSIEHFGGVLGGFLMNCCREEEALRNSFLQAMQEANREKKGMLPYLLALRSRTRQKILETYDDQKARNLIDTLLRNRTWLCPTLVVQSPDQKEEGVDERLKYIPAELHKAWASWSIEDYLTPEDIAAQKGFQQKLMDLAGEMRRRGIRFLAGTDTTLDEETPYLFPGFSLHEEMALMTAAGFTPMEALQSATRGAAEFFGEENRWGTITAGMRADLVLLDADPLADIANTRKIAGVVLNGRYLDRKKLDDMLASVAQEMK